LMCSLTSFGRRSFCGRRLRARAHALHRCRGCHCSSARRAAAEHVTAEKRKHQRTQNTFLRTAAWCAQKAGVEINERVWVDFLTDPLTKSVVCWRADKTMYRVEHGKSGRKIGCSRTNEETSAPDSGTSACASYTTTRILTRPTRSTTRPAAA